MSVKTEQLLSPVREASEKSGREGRESERKEGDKKREERLFKKDIAGK